METGLLAIIRLGCLALSVWAVIDCVIRGKQAFLVAEKLSKPVWLAITGAALLVTGFLGFFSFLGIAAVIASIVYLVDVRPAVREISNGGGRW